MSVHTLYVEFRVHLSNEENGLNLFLHSGIILFNEFGNVGDLGLCNRANNCEYQCTYLVLVSGGSNKNTMYRNKVYFLRLFGHTLDLSICENCMMIACF